MAQDVFRFVSLRPAEAVKGEDPDVIPARSPGAPRSDLQDRLLRASTPRETREVAGRFASEERFVGRPEQIDPGLASLVQTVGSLPRADVPGKIHALALAHLGSVPAEQLSDWHGIVVDSLIATMLLPERVEERARLSLTLRVLWKARAALAETDRETPHSTRASTLALPRDIFPAQQDIETQLKQATDAAEAARKRMAERRAEIERLAEHLNENARVTTALLAAYEIDRETLFAQQNEPAPKATKRPIADGLIQRGLRWIGVSASDEAVVNRDEVSDGPNTPMLSERATESLSAETRELLTARGISSTPGTLAVPETIRRLESDSDRIADRLFSAGGRGTVVLVGDVLVGSNELAPDTTRPDHFLVPGVCELSEADSPTLEISTVPHGVGSFRSLGVADLLVVRQQLLRYERGEIAHIENVMQSESRTRDHRRLERSETFLSTVTERVEETERELESTERFELQRASEETIEDITSREAGVTVTGSYGMSVEMTANAGFANESAKTQSDQFATAQAREVLDRSVQRIQEMVRSEQTRLVVNEIEESNHHGFDNSTGEAHITGIYRWVDKVYEAQVFDYGKREMLEFVVPEPAAFFRHAVGNEPVEGKTLTKPDPPGFCIERNDTFVALEPKHITRSSYKFWSARYQAKGIDPPPAAIMVVGTAIDQPWVSDDPKAVAASHMDLKVPDGYVAKRAWSAGTHAHYAYGDGDQRVPQLKIYAGRHELSRTGSTALNNEVGTVPIAIVGIHLLVFATTVECECHLTPEGFTSWQLRTYESIMAAYEEQRSRYEEQLREALAPVDEQFGTRSPTANVELIQTELKRSVISQLTGQHFDDFDAMRRHVAPHGFPQVDLAEASLEGRYVQFVEQAFEWINLQYVLYPYFWGRKEDWPTTSQLEDRDPLFGQFLRAGAARVHVPVRPGFEAAVNTFLSTGTLPWSSDPEEGVITDDDLFLSIAEEMKSQQGAVHTKSGGTVSVQQSSSTVNGTQTAFEADDVGREITIAGEVHRVAAVDSETKLQLSEPFQGPTQDGIGYVIGAKAVGEPWTVRVPTSLVLLQADAALPRF